jgi:alpha-beta hydrolase superfamily lysophospholipase
MATAPELATIFAETQCTDDAAKVKVPVLWVLGVHDKLWCATTQDCTTDPVTASEPGYYADPGQVRQYVVANTGHSINVNLGAHQFYAKIGEWLRQHELV